MKLYLGVTILCSFSVNAAFEEIAVDRLSCPSHEFRDVKVRFDTNHFKDKKVPVKVVCELLIKKLVKNNQSQSHSRFFTIGSQAESLRNSMKRAGEYFDLLVYKSDVVKFKSFKDSSHNLLQIINLIKQGTPIGVSFYKEDDVNGIPELEEKLGFYKKGIGIYVNEVQISKGPCSLINTLVHEYMHHLDYYHSVEATSDWPLTVPYYFGNRAEELCNAGVI